MSGTPPLLQGGGWGEDRSRGRDGKEPAVLSRVIILVFPVFDKCAFYFLFIFSHSSLSSSSSSFLSSSHIGLGVGTSHTHQSNAVPGSLLLVVGCCYCCCQQFGKLRIRMGKGTQDFSSAMGFPSEDEERRLGKRRGVTSQSVSQLVSLISIWQGKLLHSTTTPTKIHFSPSQAGASPPVLLLLRRGVLPAAPTETGSEGA